MGERVAEPGHIDVTYLGPPDLWNVVHAALSHRFTSGPLRKRANEHMSDKI